MNDLEYRRKQLLKLQDAVIDLEDLSSGVSITDLTMTDFRIDLARYLKAHPDRLEHEAIGVFAVTTSREAEIPPGIIFCLRAEGDGAEQTQESGYPLAPHFLVHVGDDGSVLLPYVQAKQILDRLKRLCMGRDLPDADAVGRFDRTTRQGEDMRHAQSLLAAAIASVVGKTEERAVASLFSPGRSWSCCHQQTWPEGRSSIMPTAEQLIQALELPPEAAVGQRVPKKLLLESDAPTAADRRQINDHIEALHWVAALKPATVGVPPYRDETREYLEIAVLHLRLRPGASAARLAELVHRAVPYPVLLITEQGPAHRTPELSLAHKRRSRAETDDGEPYLEAFTQALSLSRQPRRDLNTLYQGWIDTVLALHAARLTGTFQIHSAAERTAARRQALRMSAELEARIAKRRAEAVKATQLARQVELNLDIKRLEAALAATRLEL